MSFGTNGYGDASAFLQVNVWGALIIEFILTFVFVITVIGVTSKPDYKSVSGIVIGLSLAAVHLFGIPFTGTGVNPARSFGPALARAVNGDIQALSQVWVFIVAPLAGAVVAALVYKLLSYENLWLQYQKQNLKWWTIGQRFCRNRRIISCYNDYAVVLSSYSRASCKRYL